MDGVRGALSGPPLLLPACGRRAHTGRQEHRPGQGADADRLAVGNPVAEGEGEAAGNDGSPGEGQAGSKSEYIKKIRL